jgi:lipoate---protein ligase
MKTKGVASVRSPVCNVQRWNINIDHDAFLEAVIEEFKKQYGIDDEVSPSPSSRILSLMPY